VLIRAKGFGFSEIRHLGFFNFSEIRLINMGLGVLRCIMTVQGIALKEWCGQLWRLILLLLCLSLKSHMHMAKFLEFICFFRIHA
jgi:hypothetical protein